MSGIGLGRAGYSLFRSAALAAAIGCVILGLFAVAWWPASSAEDMVAVGMTPTFLWSCYYFIFCFCSFVVFGGAMWICRILIRSHSIRHGL